MKKRGYYLHGLWLSLFLGMVTLVQAQSPMSLQECLEYAEERNLLIQQAEVSLDIAEVNLQEQQFARLPNLNFSTNAGINFGRTIDPATNTFDNQRISFNSMNLNAGVPLYNGGRINAGIKQQKANLLRARSDLQNSELNQLNGVAEAFLNVLMTQEQLAAARKSLELAEQQLAQTEKLIRAGTLPENERLNLEAQVASSQQSVIAVENTLEAAMIALKANMNYPMDELLEIEAPEVEIPADFSLNRFNFSDLYQNGKRAAPVVKSAEAGVESAQSGIPLARSSLLPTVSGFASLNSNYSSAGQEIIDINTGFTDPLPAIVDGESVLVQLPSTNFETQDQPYTDQIDENFGQSIGLQLSIPIFNRLSGRAQVQRAKLNHLNAQLQYEQTLQTYGNQVQQILANTRAAEARYRAAQISVDAQRAAFANAQKRFQLGALNSLDLSTSQIALDQAELELIQAKYNYFYNIKLLEWSMSDFQGPIRLFN